MTDGMADSFDGGIGSAAARASRFRDHLRVLIVVAAVILAGLAALFAWRGHRLTVERYSARVESDVALMARDIERLIHSADLLLVQMVELARDTDWSAPEARAGAGEDLRHLRGLLPESFRLYVFDARGGLRATSIEGPVDVNVAGRAYFERHRAGKDDLDISGLMRELYDATPVFTMSRRVPGVDGSFDGVAAVTFEPRIVGQAYRGRLHAETTVFVWAHADGRVIMRESSHADGPGAGRTLVPEGETLAPELVAAFGTVAAGSGLHAVLPDGRRHLVKVLRVGTYPYYAVVGTPLAGIMRAWIAGLLPYAVGGIVALAALAMGARRWLAWAAAEDGYRERLARLLAEKDALLGQKELLIREVDHRVKNSLQLVANLLDLQAGLASDPAVREQLVEARRRVEAVGLLHRSLHAESADRIDLTEYLGHLVRGLTEATRVPVEFVRGAQAVQMCNDTVLSVGLIVNELVTNALKHAYPGGAGPIRVLLGEEKDGLRLRIADAGAGLPHDFDVRAQGNLGMRIVRMLVDNLDGALRVERLDPGTAFDIALPRRSVSGDHPDPSDPKRTTASSSRMEQ
jgi:two-component sensor histidine kinase